VQKVAGPVGNLGEQIVPELLQFLSAPTILSEIPGHLNKRTAICDDRSA
jgi:hypothetical protein